MTLVICDWSDKTKEAMDSDMKVYHAFELSKRSRQWDNEVAKVFAEPSKLPFTGYGDRFIPRRNSLFKNSRNQKFVRTNPTKDILNTHFTMNYWRQKVLKFTLNERFNIKERRMLVLSDVEREHRDLSLLRDDWMPHENKSIYVKMTSLDWPCKPRLKPLVLLEATHEMPGFFTNLDNNLIDWSVNGQIVACFGQDMIIWKRLENMTSLFDVVCPQSLSYCPNGVYLAIGCKMRGYPVLELWDVSASQFEVVSGKPFPSAYSEIVCIEWTKSGKRIVFGTTLGTMVVVSVPELRVLHKIRQHKAPIRMIKFSPTMRYLASADKGGDIIIFNWRSCTMHLQVRSLQKIAVTFDWHPWNGVDLVIAEESPASITILHTPTKKIVAFYQRKNTKIIIDSVNFSKLTGELLVSIRKTIYPSIEEAKVLVLASLDQIVDVLTTNDCGSRFLVASPDGSRIATIGDDESITIWKFCPGITDKSEKIARPFRTRDDDAANASLFFNCFGAQFNKWTVIK